MTALWIALALLALFFVLIIVRALRFAPKDEVSKGLQTKAEVDVDTATDHLRQMIRLQTVSHMDESQMDVSQWEAFQQLLQTLYPHVYATCEYEIIAAHGILLRWKGRESGAPAVLMAHYDVVPADPSEWDEPPFEGVLKDDELWGRGTLDTKGTLMGVMEAAEALIAEGFTPANDLYLAFGGNEECNGGDANAIVAELERRGIRPAMVLDEGGAIVDNVFPGVKQPAALIGVAEKGSLFVDLTARGKSGHASAPPAKQSAGVLAKALYRLNKKPMPFTLTAPARELFDRMGRHSTFLYKLIFANLWCFAPLLNFICKKSGGEMNALTRTTCAFTRLSAADAYNVLPAVSKAGINLRIIPGETTEQVVKRMQRTIGDKRVEVSIVNGNDPSPISPADGEMWNRVSRAIQDTYAGVLVSPYLMLACSDSRHYCRICDCVYRFSGMPLTKEQRGMIHGKNERIPVSLIPDLVRFFRRVMEQC